MSNTFLFKSQQWLYCVLKRVFTMNTTKRWCAKLRKIKNMLKREWKRQIINFFFGISFHSIERMKKEWRKKMRILSKSRYAKRCFYNNNMRKKKTSEIYCSIFSAAASILFYASQNCTFYWFSILMEIISCSSCPRLCIVIWILNLYKVGNC